jgi:dipeptidyl aminopeptidase/acylaminoacyl peptidase
VTDKDGTSRIPLRRDAQQWVYDWVVKETGKVFHFQPDGRGTLPPSVRSHAMIAKHLGLQARRVEQVAAEEAAAGHPETALDWYFDAATLYAEAQHTVLAPTDEKRFLHGASIRCFDAVRELAPYTIEHVDIPWNDTVVSGNLHLVPGDEPRPLVFFIPGCDMTKEMAPHPHFNHALQRGMHVFVFDGPGQGESNIRDIVLTQTNYEEAASAALDVLLERPDVDGDKVGVLALSFGSYWGVRFAGTDSRIAALAAPWASVCDKRYLMEQESPRYKQLFAYLTRASSEAELDEFIQGMVLDDVVGDITAPTLLAIGEYDPRSPLEEVYNFYDAITADKELWVFGDQHHMASVRLAPAALWSFDMYQFAMDWLRDRLTGQPLRNPGQVVFLEPGRGGGGPNGETPKRNRRWYENV